MINLFHFFLHHLQILYFNSSYLMHSKKYEMKVTTTCPKDDVNKYQNTNKINCLLIKYAHNHVLLVTSK